MVIGLGIRPLVCLCQILKSSDEIRCGNGVLAFGTKEFRNLVLLHSKVEAGRAVGSCRGWRGGDVPLTGGVPGIVIVGVDIDIGVFEVVVLLSDFDVVGSSVSCGHSYFAEALFLLYQMPFGSGSVAESSLRVVLLASESAFLLSVVFFLLLLTLVEFEKGVVSLRCRRISLFSVGCRFPLLFQNVVQGAGFRKNRCTPV